MASKPETGFLVIADLTGYTAYLAGSEIEHAPTIAGDLLETIVGRLEPPFRLMKFEGDAAFLFVEDGRADGSLLLDAIEAATSPSADACAASTRPPAATATRAGWLLASISSCSSTMARSSAGASPVATR